MARTCSSRFNHSVVGVCRALSGLLLGAVMPSAASAQICAAYPAGFVPFAAISYVTPTNSSGDRLVVGTLPMPDGLRAIDNRIPLPAVPNQTFCEDRIGLGPASTYDTVYVPSAEERSGRHSAFSGLLRDPDTGVPFPNGIIPPNRFGGVYAWRIGPLRPVALVSSASGRAVVAPDSLATIYGVNLARNSVTGHVDPSGQYPIELDGVTVRLAGRAVQLLYVSPHQINCLVPKDAPAGIVEASVQSANDANVRRGTATIQAEAPGLFALDATGAGAIVNAVTGSLSPFAVETPENPGADKATRLSLFGTGFRNAGPVKVEAVDGLGQSFNLVVEYAGQAPGYPGLDQVNIVLPLTMAQSPGVVTFVRTRTGVSNAVHFFVRGVIDWVFPNDGKCDAKTEQLAYEAGRVAAQWMRTVGKAPLGAYHLNHFLDASGTPLYYARDMAPSPEFLDVPQRVKNSARYLEIRASVLRRLANFASERFQQQGSLPASAEIAEFLKALKPTFDPADGYTTAKYFTQADDPDLFWAIHGINAIRIVVRDVEISPAGVVARVTFSFADLYKFYDWHRDRSLWPARLEAAAMLYLQENCRTVQPYRTAIQVEDELTIGSCEQVYAGPYSLRVWNDLPGEVDFQFVDVVAPGLGRRIVPFAALMDPGVCEIYGVPILGVYTVDVNRRPDRPKKRLLVTFDSEQDTGFVIGGERVSVLRLSEGAQCKDGQIVRFFSQPAYTACLP